MIVVTPYDYDEYNNTHHLPFTYSVLYLYQTQIKVEVLVCFE